MARDRGASPAAASPRRRSRRGNRPTHEGRCRTVEPPEAAPARVALRRGESILRVPMLMQTVPPD
jgi:hypothetical protein